MSPETFSAISAAVDESAEEEICGLLVGLLRDGAAEIKDVWLKENVALDPRRQFEIAPAELLKAHKIARVQGMEIIGHIHSHPSGPLKPSQRDVQSIADPNALWLIAGLNSLGAIDVRAFIPNNDANGFCEIEISVRD